VAQGGSQYSPRAAHNAPAPRRVDLALLQRISKIQVPTRPPTRHRICVGKWLTLPVACPSQPCARARDAAGQRMMAMAYRAVVGSVSGVGRRLPACHAVRGGALRSVYYATAPDSKCVIQVGGRGEGILRAGGGGGGGGVFTRRGGGGVGGVRSVYFAAAPGSVRSVSCAAVRDSTRDIKLGVGLLQGAGGAGVGGIFTQQGGGGGSLLPPAVHRGGASHGVFGFPAQHATARRHTWSRHRDS